MSHKQKAHSHHDQTIKQNKAKLLKKKIKTQTRGIAWKNNLKIKWNNTQIPEPPCNNFHAIR
jgi:hypothetical protein